MDAATINEQLSSLFESAVKVVSAQPVEFLVLPENWPAVQLFIACQTQWHHIVLPDKVIRTGLNYPAVVAIIKMRFENENTSILFSKLQQAEQVALAVFNDQ